MSKVNAYNKIIKDRKAGKTNKLPVGKAISRSDFSALMKAKMYSDVDYMKTFVKLLTNAGMDRDDAVTVLVKDNISNKVFEELFELFADTAEDVLKAESGFILLAKEDIRATLEGEYVEEEIQSIAHLKKSKFTHIRKGDFYKVKCKSRVLESKIQKGSVDKKGNFVPGE